MLRLAPLGTAQRDYTGPMGDRSEGPISISTAVSEFGGKDNIFRREIPHFDISEDSCEVGFANFKGAENTPTCTKSLSVGLWLSWLLRPVLKLEGVQYRRCCVKAMILQDSQCLVNTREPTHWLSFRFGAVSIRFPSNIVSRRLLHGQGCELIPHLALSCEPHVVPQTAHPDLYRHAR